MSIYQKVTAWVTGPVVQIAEKDKTNMGLEFGKEPLKNSRSVQSPKRLATKEDETMYTKLCDGKPVERKPAAGK